MPNTSPILTVTTAANAPMMVWEELRVYANGRSTLHILAAADPQRRDQAGTYQTTLEEGRLAQVQQVVDSLLALPPPGGDRFPGGIKSIITVSAGERSQSHLLPAQLVAPASPPLAQAAAVVGEIVAATFARPLAALRLSAAVKATAPAASLLITCTSLGLEAVSFLFRPESFTIWQETADSAQPVWQNSAGKSVGLIDGAGKLVDGMYTAADMPPNSTATAVYTQILPTMPPTMRLEAAGWLTLLTRNGETPVLSSAEAAVSPQDAFGVTAVINR